MSDKVLSKQDFLKRTKLDNEKLQFFVDRKILKEKKNYTDKDIESVRAFRKINPLDINEIVKKFKLSKDQINSFKSKLN